MTVTLSDIQSVDWSPKVGQIGAVVQGDDDINQCICIILSTPKGSDPHRPLFGSDIWKWIDAPVNVAIPNIILEGITAVTTWEPRVEVKSIVPVIENEHVTMTVQWVHKETGEKRITEVTV